MSRALLVSLILIANFLGGCESTDKVAPVEEPQVTTEPLPDFNKPSTGPNGPLEEPTVPEAKPSPSPTPAPSPTPMPVTTIVPKPGSKDYTAFQTKVYGGTEKQRKRLLAIALNTEKVLNSEIFKKRLLNNKYKGKIGFYGHTAKPSYVLSQMLEADEFNRGKIDYIWQYELYIQKLPSGVLGRMYWPKDPIYFNSIYLDNRPDSGLAGTYCHEKSHQLGFSHSAKYTKERQYSIPYVLGTICAEIYKQMKFPAIK